MKNLHSILIVLLVAMTSVVFTSCEKEQDELIIGTWSTTSLEVECYINGEYDADNSTKDRLQETWTFNKGGQLIVKYDGESDTYTYNVQGNQLHTNLVRDYFSETKTYFNIETLNSNTMVLSLEEEQYVDGGYGGPYGNEYYEGYSVKNKFTVYLKK